jgi:hypothetical protein
VLAGHWRSPDETGSETWIDLGGPLVGVGFAGDAEHTGFFEVMLVHRDGDRWILTAMPGGASQVDFPAVDDDTRNAIAFAAPDHDDPKRIRYRRTGDWLVAELDGDSGPRAVSMQRATAGAAPELEAADRAFAADSSSRGGAAWAARFDNGAAMWPRGSDRVEGPAAVGAAIDRVIDRGLSLSWSPSASGWAPARDWGFTTGRYQFALPDTVAAAGIYVTVWRRGDDGAWAIAFDTGLATSRPGDKASGVPLRGPPLATLLGKPSGRAH